MRLRWLTILTTLVLGWLVVRAAAQAPALTPQQLVYVGSSRFPQWTGSDADSFAYGGFSAGWNAIDRTLIASGHQNFGKTAEINLPSPIITSTKSALPIATYKQRFTDVLAGKLSLAGNLIGGYLRRGADLIVSAYVYYDGSGTATLSHFLTKADWTTAPIGAADVRGPFSMGTQQAGIYGGPMAWLPPDWKSALGTDAFSGQCCLTIISRTSRGPSVSGFKPADVGVGTPIPAFTFTNYPVDHPTLGDWSSKGTVFNMGAMGSAVLPIANTRTALVPYRIGKGDPCYGLGTKDQSLHNTLIPGTTDKYCYDEADQTKGSHAYPYENVWLAFDRDEYAAVKAGTRAPWSLVPQVWPMTLPFPTLKKEITGVYDDVNQRVIVIVPMADGDHPLMHFFQIAAVNAPTPTPSPSPTPTPTPTPSPTPTPTPTPAPVPLTTITVTSKACTFTLTAQPPDTLGGWKIQFKRDANVNVGLSIGTAPYVRNTTLNAGVSASYYGVWTKSGVPSVTTGRVTKGC